MKHGLLGFISILIICQGTQAFSFDLGVLDWRSLEREFTTENKTFKGHFNSGKNWDGFFCSGGYNYAGAITGLINDIQFDLNGQGSIDATADIRTINATASGDYKSEYSSCFRIYANLGLLIDWISAKARITFTDPEHSAKIKVDVLSTEFGTIHLGNHVPSIVEIFVTKATNAAFRGIWASVVGDWLNAKITKYVNDKLPAYARNSN
jgi:hypothetical protein